MKILIACEFSGRVREAFTQRGHDAWSCDLLKTEIPGQHIQGDMWDVMGDGWDMLIAFPDCTYLANSGNGWHAGSNSRARALEGVKALMGTDIPQWAIENPVGAISKYRKPSQIIQPWQFGHGETKSTCLWLHGLPLLKATNVVKERETKVWKERPSAQRWRNRARTYQGIADAMGEQWG